jgi:hypothetical protein
LYLVININRFIEESKIEDLTMRNYTNRTFWRINAKVLRTPAQKAIMAAMSKSNLSYSANCAPAQEEKGRADVSPLNSALKNTL